MTVTEYLVSLINAAQQMIALASAFRLDALVHVLVAYLGGLLDALIASLA